MNAEEMCSSKSGCTLIIPTAEELEKRAIVQRNDLILHEAVIKNDTESVRKILKEPIEVNSRNNVSKRYLIRHLK